MRARAMTTEEEEAMASEKQRSEPFIAGAENPTVVLSGQINQTFPTHDMVAEFEFDNVTAGDFEDVVAGQTIWYGSTSGARDLGFGRVRKIPLVDTMYCNETSEIRFADNIFFTVVDEMLLLPKHVKVVDGTVYMDYDISYDDQHENFDPVPIMGDDVVVDVTEYPAEVRFPNMDDSYVFDAEVTDYLLEATEGVVTDEDTTDPLLTINSYPTNGRIRVKFTVAADNGKSFSCYRYVYVYDADHRPHSIFNISNVEGDLSSGYWSYEVTIFDNAGITSVRERAPIILFGNDWYGDEKISFGQLEHRENFVCKGWVAGEVLQYTHSGKGVVKFRVEGAGYYLDRMNGFPPGVRMAKNTPALWVDMTKLNVDRAAWHLLHWRSTATAVMDVYLTDDDRYAVAFITPSQSIWAQLKEIAYTSIFASPVVDRFGRLFLEIDPQLVPEGDRTWPTVTELDRDDWLDKVEPRRNIMTQSAQLLLSGVAVDSTGKGTPLFSLSNGHIPKTYGKPDIIENILLESQAKANELCGLAMALRNQEIDPFQIHLPANNRMIDIAPRMKIAVTIDPADTIRAFGYTGDTVPSVVGFEWDEEANCWSTYFTVEPVITPELNMNGDLPDDAGFDLDLSVPPLPEIEYPDFVYDYPAPTDFNPNFPKKIIMAVNPFGVVYTENANVSDSTKVEWKGMNFGLDTADKTDISDLIVTPNGAVYIVTNNHAGLTNVGRRRIYRASQLGAAWELYYDATEEAEVRYVTGIGFNPEKAEQIAFHTSEVFVPAVLGGTFEGSYFHIGNGSGYTTTLCPVDITGTHFPLREYRSAVLFSQDKWYVFGSRAGGIANIPIPYMNSFSSGGTLLTDDRAFATAFGADGAPRHGLCPAAADAMYVWSAGGYAGYTVITAGGTSDSYTTGASPDTYQGMAFSPAGQVGVSNDTGLDAMRETSDGGSSWSAPGSLLVGPDVFDDCNDDNRFLIGGGTALRFSADVGDTYTDISGNLGYVAPLGDITAVRFIE